MLVQASRNMLNEAHLWDSGVRSIFGIVIFVLLHLNSIDTRCLFILANEFISIPINVLCIHVRVVSVYCVNSSEIIVVPVFIA